MTWHILRVVFCTFAVRYEDRGILASRRCSSISILLRGMMTLVFVNYSEYTDVMLMLKYRRLYWFSGLSWWVWVLRLMNFVWRDFVVRSMNFALVGFLLDRWLMAWKFHLCGIKQQLLCCRDQLVLFELNIQLWTKDDGVVCFLAKTIYQRLVVSSDDEFAPVQNMLEIFDTQIYG